MKIRTANTTDSITMHDIHTRAVSTSCKDFYTPEQIVSWLEARSPEGYHEGIQAGEMFVLEENRQVIGFGHAIPGEILAIFIDPDFQGKGFGAEFLKYLINVAAKDQKTVKVSAALNAETFYQKHGFKKIRDELDRRTRIPLEAVVMELKL